VLCCGGPDNSKATRRTQYDLASLSGRPMQGPPSATVSHAAIVAYSALRNRYFRLHAFDEAQSRRERAVPQATAKEKSMPFMLKIQGRRRRSAAPSAAWA
jgi:hypothetical protein